MASLVLKSLRKVYRNGITAIDGIDYQSPGGTIGLVGPNGAGKTTLMRILCTITRATSGKALVNGMDAARQPQHIRQILGYLPQQFDFYPTLRVVEVLSYLADLKHVRPRDRGSRVEEAMHLTGLTGLRSRPVGTLSGGMKRRLGIAQAVLNKPEILIVDEPTAGLDPEERVHFRSMLSGFSRTGLVVLSTHIVSDVEAVASQIVMLSGGRIRFSGTPSEATAKVAGLVWQVSSQDPASAFLGDYPECTLVSSRQEGDRVVVRLLSNKPPSSDAESVHPTLEDAYLYIVGGSR
mgnify:FL=1|jgi:ABC-type multidrug transport system ATPase subunit